MPEHAIADQRIEWPDVARSAIWPGAALLLMLLFLDPITALMNSTANTGAMIHSLKLGKLEVTLAAGKGTALVAPKVEVAQSVIKLSPVEIHDVITGDDIVPDSACLHMKDDATTDWEGEADEESGQLNTIDNARIAHLIRLRIYNFDVDPLQSGDNPFCTGYWGDYRLSDHGVEVKDFLIDVTSKALKLSLAKSG